MNKRLLSIIIGIVAVLSAGASEITSHDNRLYITVGDFSDISQVPVHLYLASPTIDITAVELYIGLPDGSSLSEGTLNTTLCDDTHELVEGETDNGWFVSIASDGLKPFTSGEICSWTCDLSALQDGIYNITATGIFDVGVDTSGVNCYVASDQSESFTISSGIVTGIEEVQKDAGTLVIYNLQGIRLTEPQPGQINIINGRKELRVRN